MQIPCPLPVDYPFEEGPRRSAWPFAYPHLVRLPIGPQLYQEGQMKCSRCKIRLAMRVNPKLSRRMFLTKSLENFHFKFIFLPRVGFLWKHVARPYCKYSNRLFLVPALDLLGNGKRSQQ